MIPDRRPPAKIEARDPHSIRFKPSEWDLFVAAAREVGLEVTRYVRECALTGHSFEQMQAARKGSVRVTA